jgi:hypothetical protein
MEICYMSNSLLSEAMDDKSSKWSLSGIELWLALMDCNMRGVYTID